MRDLGKIVLHIPARAGSQRVKTKNLRFLAGEPLLAYSVKAALGSGFKKDVFVNTESELIARLAEELGAGVYRRPAELSSDSATSDQFNMDIIDALVPDTLIQINPVCPLIDAADIDSIVEVFQASEADTLITTSATQLQCFCRGEPVNIDLGNQLAPTQSNPPVHVCNWAVSVWDAGKFRERFRKKGFAVFGENRILHPIHPLKAVKISTEEDFQLAEFLMESRISKDSRLELKPRYWG